MRKILCAGGFLFLYHMSWPQASRLLNAGDMGSRPLTIITTANQPVSLLNYRVITAAVAGEKKFLFPSYGQYSLGLAIPEGKNCFGFSVEYGGSSLLSQTLVHLAYARSLGEKLGLALQFNYQSLSLPGIYGKASAIYARLGGAIQLTQQLKMAFHITDPFKNLAVKNGETIHSGDYSAGFGYQPSEKMYAGLLVKKQELQDPQVIVDLLYDPVSSLRVNGQLDLTNGSAGIGLQWKQKYIQFGLMVAIHPQLGISPVSILQFQSMKNKLP